MGTLRATRFIAALAVLGMGACALTGLQGTSASARTSLPGDAEVSRANLLGVDLAAMCTPDNLRRVTQRLSTKVTLAQLPKAEIPGPYLPDGVAYTPASATKPAYCQVTGTFVTNPKTGKTANFLATLPAAWNHKYLQFGCGGHCGTFAVSNAALPTITISVQGRPADSLQRGYASFATDQGHAGFKQGEWAIKASGGVDDDAIQDYLYRANKVLAGMGKEFAKEFYSQASGSSQRIAYSYFCGCSGGGRDALVAASYFPEEFDGFVSGSPYANMANLGFLSTGVSLAAARSADAAVPPALVAAIDPIVKARCDAVDGVKDGLIQNPAACDFRPERDLPRCNAGGEPGKCFTKAQIETVSTLLTAATDQSGKVVEPGYAVSDVQAALLAPPPQPGTPTPWPDEGNPGAGGGGGIAPLGDAVIRIFAKRNPPNFSTASMTSYASGGPGPISGFRVVADADQVKQVNAAVRMGIGDIAANYSRMLRLNRKLLMWVNSSDQLLTPYGSVNFYNRLAKRFGGYPSLQKNVRMFMLPGTAHCSGGGTGQGPGSFDALAAIEIWVEKRQAPDSLPATLYAATPFGVNFSKPLGRTMPLCKFPTMARYGGKGDLNEGANWSCPAGDTSMLKLGESGRQAGVLN